MVLRRTAESYGGANSAGHPAEEMLPTRVALSNGSNFGRRLERLLACWPSAPPLFCACGERFCICHGRGAAVSVGKRCPLIYTSPRFGCAGKCVRQAEPPFALSGVRLDASVTRPMKGEQTPVAHSIIIEPRRRTGWRRGGGRDSSAAWRLEAGHSSPNPCALWMAMPRRSRSLPREP